MPTSRSGRIILEFIEIKAFNISYCMHKSKNIKSKERLTADNFEEIMGSWNDGRLLILPVLLFWLLEKNDWTFKVKLFSDKYAII